MTPDKLNILCAELGTIARTYQHFEGTARRAIALLRAYDELAEYALHNVHPPCPVLASPRTADCTCGLETQQRKIAAILEGRT